jgi:hypothetical protein
MARKPLSTGVLIPVVLLVGVAVAGCSVIDSDPPHSRVDALVTSLNSRGEAVSSHRWTGEDAVHMNYRNETADRSEFVFTFVGSAGGDDGKLRLSPVEEGEDAGVISPEVGTYAVGPGDYEGIFTSEVEPLVCLGTADTDCLGPRWQYVVESGSITITETSNFGMTGRFSLTARYQGKVVGYTAPTEQPFSETIRMEGTFESEYGFLY